MAHKPYYLTKRADKGGVFYARFVLDLPRGGTKVLPWISTGKTDKNEAADWCNVNGPKIDRVRAKETMPFGAFADGWWCEPAVSA